MQLPVLRRPALSRLAAAAALVGLAAGLASGPAAGKDVPNHSTARPAPALSPAQRAALATKDAVRMREEVRPKTSAPGPKSAPIVSLAPAAAAPAGVAGGASPSAAVAKRGRAPVAAAERDAALLALLRARMGPERAAEFGLGKPVDPIAAPRASSVAGRPAAPAAPEAHR